MSIMISLYGMKHYWDMQSKPCLYVWGSGYAVVREALYVWGSGYALYKRRRLSVGGLLQQGVDQTQTCIRIEHTQWALQTFVYLV